ncbi:hypothetical protein [Bradyrhizobium sp. WD16]|uniref:hypothetical protein n=1 Tax=Bradyrhizobium sp. WD16 TaxID=1521768 RepID=UPI0020A51C79|nr:hypothetical protein [Bradyrhizobium sp. WD16]UTD28244.1 hypothetical protein DB459_16420 [Bradyrhizobium sp. WD16]
MGVLDYVLDGSRASRIAPLALPNSAAPFGVLTPQEQAQIPAGLPEKLTAAMIDGLTNVIATPGRILQSKVPLTTEDMIGPALDTALLLSGPKPPPFARRLGLPPLPPGGWVTHIGPNGPVVEGLQGRAAEATDWLR